MKLFNEWWEKYNADVKSSFEEDVVAKNAFKAGMLAAADLVKPMYVTDDYDAGKEGASTIIREEIDEQTLHDKFKS